MGISSGEGRNWPTRVHAMLVAVAGASESESIARPPRTPTGLSAQPEPGTVVSGL